MSEQSEQPLHVVRGEPTEDEIAALVAVISAKAAEADESGPQHSSDWAAYWHTVRAPLQPGPGAWLASARPR